jgi:hypothetical protein
VITIEQELRATLDRCVKVLQGVQWSATEHDKYGQSEGRKCPSCEASDFLKHFDDCELAACIRDGNELIGNVVEAVGCHVGVSSC